jgi:hypothetical protein
VEENEICCALHGKILDHDLVQGSEWQTAKQWMDLLIDNLIVALRLSNMLLSTCILNYDVELILEFCIQWSEVMVAGQSCYLESCICVYLKDILSSALLQDSMVSGCSHSIVQYSRLKMVAKKCIALIKMISKQ